MLDREFKIERVGFLKGTMAAIELYAIWRDGKRRVGIMGNLLESVLLPYKDELSRLEKELKGD